MGDGSAPFGADESGIFGGKGRGGEDEGGGGAEEGTEVRFLARKHCACLSRPSPRGRGMLRLFRARERWMTRPPEPFPERIIAN